MTSKSVTYHTPTMTISIHKGQGTRASSIGMFIRTTPSDQPYLCVYVMLENTKYNRKAMATAIKTAERVERWSFEEKKATLLSTKSR